MDSFLRPLGELRSLEMLTLKEKGTLTGLAFDALSASLQDREIGKPQDCPRTLEAFGSAFVTWKNEGRLRGCLGTLRQTAPLWTVVRDMAIAAATRDPRFSPIEKDEVFHLEVDISVLGPFRPVLDVDEIEIGKHGLYIVSQDNSGILLPQVATEYGWDRRTFLEHTCLKAQIDKDAWRGDADLMLFEAEVFGATYTEMEATGPGN